MDGPTTADKAREAAFHMESKKHELRQLQEGDWKITFTVAATDMKPEFLSAPMGTRYVMALCQKGDDEKPVKAEGEKERTPFHELPRSQQAGILGNESAFREFIKNRLNMNFTPDEEETARLVRRICHVKSRSELDTPGEHTLLWDNLVSRYHQWAGRMPEER